MELKATTRQGKTLVIDDQTVRVKQVFGDLFSAPRENVVGITVVPVGGVLAGAVITFYLRDADPYEVQIIDSKGQVKQITALFEVLPVPPVQEAVIESVPAQTIEEPAPIEPETVEPVAPQVVIVQQVAPVQQRAETKVITYKDAKAMEKGMQKEAQDGWIAQNSISTGGKISVPKMVLLGPLLGGGRSKERFTITYVRQIQG